MFVVVHHKISDPERFWSRAEEFLASIPPDLRLHTTLPVADGTRATCLWECSALPRLRDLMDKYSVGIAKNEYVPVDEARAMGLPAKTIREAQAAEGARA